MKHPGILLLPLLMFADYFLTVLGAIAREKIYARHFRMEHYELNPVWQKSIARKQWFNLRHTLAVIALSSLLAWLLEVGDMPDEFNQFVLGTILTMFATRGFTQRYWIEANSNFLKSQSKPISC